MYGVKGKIVWMGRGDPGDRVLAGWVLGTDGAVGLRGGSVERLVRAFGVALNDY